jgi:hypothetical protein
MLLSKYISDLQEFLVKHGDMNCLYAADDEGNSYQQVGWSGSLYLTTEPDEYSPELMSEENHAEHVKECKESGWEIETFTKVCVVN